MFGPNRIGTNLTGQVDLNAGVNGRHFGVSHNVDRVVNIGHIKIKNVHIIINVIMPFLRSNHESRCALITMKLFLTVINGSTFNEFKSTITPHLSMKAKMLMIL